MTEHWLLRFHLALRTGPGEIRLGEGMNASWRGGNWRFSSLGTLALFAFSFSLGVVLALCGRWFWTHV